jgi:hypothetical protein
MRTIFDESHRKRFLWLFGFLIIFHPASSSHAGTNYDAVDRHALHAPPEVSRSIPVLAHYLTDPFSLDDEKSRAIFRWVAENINYDVKGFFSGKIEHETSGDVLKSRKAVCEGYSGLFEQLARAAGLEVVSISGFAKGYGYSSGGKIPDKSNHAWNAVKIEGEWKLLDCTWGAGHVGDQRDYVRKFTPHYFFTPPPEFIYDHFPEDSCWQLLEKPLRRQEFQSLVYLRPKYFEMGMYGISESAGVIRSNGEVIIHVQAPRNVLCMGTLQQKEKTLRENFVFVQRINMLFEIRIQPPEPGDYIFHLFAKGREEEGAYEWAAEYLIHAEKVQDAKNGYPQVFQEFDEHGCSLLSPFQAVLPPGLPAIFRIKVPGAEEAAVIINKDWMPLKKRGDVFEGAVSVRKGAVRLCAKFPGRKDFAVLLEYRGS